jgi:CoA:oxalate CoA-transferase
MTPLLRGIRVLELSDGLGAAFAGRLFSRLGADVILLERPRTGSEVRWKAPFLKDLPGVERSGLFQFTAAGKRSVTLRPDHPDGHEIFAELVRRADVVLEDRAPELGARLAEDTLRGWNPRATIVSLSPFGASEAATRPRATELEIAALGGWMVQVGEPGREPLVTASETMSAFVPGYFGAIAALASVIGGGGRRIDVSAREALLATTRYNETYAHATGTEIKRAGKSFGGWVPTYRVFEASDGWVTCAASTDAQVELLMQLAGVDDERFATREGRYAHADEFVEALSRWTRSKTRDEIFHEAQAWRIPMGAVKSIDEVEDLEQLRERKFFETVEHPMLGRMRMPGGPARFLGEPPIEPRRAPLLGEHTEDVLRGELGIDAATLAALRAVEVA